MPVIVTPHSQIWTRQPPQFPAINRANPLTRGLVALIVPDGLAPRNAVNNAVLTVGSGFTALNFLVNGKSGKALQVNGVSGGINANLTLPSSGLSTRSFTIAGRIKTLASNGVGVGIRDNGSNIVLWRNGTTFDMRLGGTDYTGAGTYALDTIYDYAITSGASAARLFVNGNIIINGGVAGSGTLANLLVGSDPQGGGAHNLEFEWFGIWNRELTQSEIRSVAVQPYQLAARPDDIVLFDVSTSSAQLITISNSSQSNAASDASIAQTHLLSISNSQQSNIASDAAIRQTHVLTVSNSTQSNQATDAAIAQTHLVSASNSTQSNQCSDVSVAQSSIAYIGIANSQQTNQASSAAIGQTHVVSIASSQQVNTASSVEVTHDNVQRISIANSQQSNQCSAASIQVTHRITASNSAVANQASPIVIGQVHLIFGADSIHVNQCSQVALKANSQVRPITPTYSTVLIDADYQQLQINSGYNTINIDSDYRP